MAEKLATLSRGGGEPAVEIVIGFAQFGKYRFSLSDSTGQAFTTIFEGDNADSRPDKFVIPESPEVLQNRILRWKVIVAAFETGPGQMYSVMVKITQDGTNVPDGPFRQKGELDGVKVIEDEVRFTLS